MARIWKRSIAKIMTALAMQPALRGAVLDYVSQETRRKVLDVDLVSESEMDVMCYSAHRPEMHARYDGMALGWREQMAAMGERKLKNGCFSARADFEAFVKARER